jgi:hypothetical protein
MGMSTPTWDKRPIADEFPHAGSFDELVGPVEGDGHSHSRPGFALGYESRRQSTARHGE